MAFDFPAAPVVGQKFPATPTPGLPVYTWDGEKWTTYGGSSGTLDASVALPLINASPALPGSSIKYSREDHVHPTDTTRAAASAVTAATLAEYLSNNPQSRMVTSGTLWSAAGPVTIVDTSGTITCDFSTGIDFSVSVTAAGRTLANPVNVKSQKGLIYLFANAAGASITTWGNQWIFPGGVKPTLSANGARDAISYSYFAGINLAFCSFQPDFR